MNIVKVIDTYTNKSIFTAKNNKQAEQAIFRLNRQDRLTGDFAPYRYIIVVTGHRTDRLNKQARRAFELQEV